jgi:hypothetical protein
MGAINWTKDFDVYTDHKIPARIFVSEHEEGFFLASCLWFDEERLLKAGNEERTLAIQHEKFIGETETEATQKIFDWVKSKFGENATIKGK